MKSSKTAVSATVDGVSGCNEIADMFANQYDELYSCIAYDGRELASLKNDINNRLCSQAYNQDSKVTVISATSMTRFKSLNEANVTDLAA